jgi:hypothetical protein
VVRAMLVNVAIVADCGFADFHLGSNIILGEYSTSKLKLAQLRGFDPDLENRIRLSA